LSGKDHRECIAMEILYNHTAYHDRRGGVGTLTGFGTSTIMVPILLFIPASFIGAHGAKKIVNRVPQKQFRVLVAVFLLLVGIKLLIFPS